MAWPDTDTLSVQLAVAIVLGLAWVGMLAARLLIGLSQKAGSTTAKTAPASQL